jgi:hypothetical protein
MITLSLRYDPQTKMDRFANGYAPVMRICGKLPVSDYASHMELLEFSVNGGRDCFAPSDADARGKAADAMELAEMRTMTPEQWLSMEAAKSYRQQWVRYHAAKLNPALRYSFPVCLQLQSVPSRS